MLTNGEWRRCLFGITPMRLKTTTLRIKESDVKARMYGANDGGRRKSKAKNADVFIFVEQEQTSLDFFTFS